MSTHFDTRCLWWVHSSSSVSAWWENDTRSTEIISQRWDEGQMWPSINVFYAFFPCLWVIYKDIVHTVQGRDGEWWSCVLFYAKRRLSSYVFISNVTNEWNRNKSELSEERWFNLGASTRIWHLTVAFYIRGSFVTRCTLSHKEKLGDNKYINH